MKLKTNKKCLSIVSCLILVFTITGANNAASQIVYDAGLGDYVWDDSNRNGIQDAGEVGIPKI